MGKKDKKKGKGAEKTAAKTEKKATQKLKKELASKGEEDVEKLIAAFKKEDMKKQQVMEELTTQPSIRSGMTMCINPEKEELVFFGGEYFNGSKTFMYNDLYLYNIKKNQWLSVHCPGSPPPRCAHQVVVVSQGGGQMWLFGGEFASPTRSQFYHYRDFWVYHFSQKKWEQVNIPGGPSARSGHRMTVCRRKIMVFGGFHESVRDYKYFNDVYAFDLDAYKWTKLEPVGTGPSPRSACQVAATSDGKMVVYGGYSREKVKKEVDKGIVHTDLFILQCENRGGVDRWKWVTVKQSGVQPSPRCGFSLATIAPNQALLFGGVCDEEDEENLSGSFFNDSYILELDKGRWSQIQLRGKRDTTTEKKKRRRKEKNETSLTENNDKEKEEGEDSEMSNEENDVDMKGDEMNETQIEKLKISVDSDMMEEAEMVKTTEDGVFTVKIGPQASSAADDGMNSKEQSNETSPFIPHPRMNASLAVKHGHLYLYGGLYEAGDRQITLSDFHVLDLHKMDEWRTIIPLDTQTQEWLESSESEDDDDGIDENEEEMDVEGACGGASESEDSSADIQES